jgi:hypothetical protein
MNNSIIRPLCQSGFIPACSGAVGFFAASAMSLGAAAAVGSVATVAGTCFLGGAALYLPLFLIKKGLQACGLLIKKSNLTMLLAADCAAIILSGAVGAYILGQAMLPFIICAAIGLFIIFAVQIALRVTNLHSGNIYPSNQSHEDEANFNNNIIPAPIGACF